MNVRLNRVAGIALVLISASYFTSPAEAVVPRAILKTFFQTGDKPTQEQFGNLIDSYIHQTDDGLTLYAIGASRDSGGTLNALRLGGNVGINEQLPDTVLHVWRPVAQPGGDSVAPMCPQFCGTSGFLPLQYKDSTGDSHYGFLQIDMGPDPGASPGAEIFVTQWVWEPLANTSVTTFAVPEPGTGIPIALAASLAWLGRRKSRRS